MNNDLYNEKNTPQDTAAENSASEAPEEIRQENDAPIDTVLDQATAPTDAQDDTKDASPAEATAEPQPVTPTSAAANEPANELGDQAPPQPTQPPVSSHTYTSYNPAPTPKREEPPRKAKKSGFPRGAVAVLCVCTILLSCASGFIGAYLATLASDGQPNPEGYDKIDAVVIYQSASNPTSGMSTDNGSSAYYNVAEIVHASVVEITTEHLVNSYFQYVTQGAGSGIILSEDGYILTNNHVIADTENNNELASAITVRMTTGEEFKATVVGTDADSDIAVIKIDAANLPAVLVGDSDKLAVGEEVVAVGNPLGELGGTVTNGIISALDREINVDGTMMNLLQTNTAINPGNSGGGLFNMAGELIGVVNAKSSGTGIEGLGFAIPANDAINIAEQLITNGYVSGKPYLGVSFYDVTSPTQALYYNLKHLGVYIVGLEEGLNDTVFEIGDRVIAMDGNEISTRDDVKTILKTHEVGDKITFTIYRNGKMKEVEATCFELIPDSSDSVEFEK